MYFFFVEILSGQAVRLVDAVLVLCFQGQHHNVVVSVIEHWSRLFAVKREFTLEGRNKGNKEHATLNPLPLLCRYEVVFQQLWVSRIQVSPHPHILPPHKHLLRFFLLLLRPLQVSVEAFHVAVKWLSIELLQSRL